MAIVDKLRQILGYKNDIKEAIANKGLKVTDDMSSYANNINKLISIDEIVAKTIKEVDFDRPDLIHYSMPYLFQNCKQLKKVRMRINSSYVHPSCGYMFDGCSALEEVDMGIPSGIVTAYAYRYMFRDCVSLKESLPLNTTDPGQDTFSYMYYGCTSLEKAGEIKATGNFRSSYTFANCTSLREMTWTATYPPTIVASIWENCPEDMIIYVPDSAVDKYKVAAVWSSRAAYIRPVSEKPTE